jgi:hypothetical protein
MSSNRRKIRFGHRVSSAIRVAEAMPLRFSLKSRYASSSDSGSTMGVYSAKISRICSEIAL